MNEVLKEIMPELIKIVAGSIGGLAIYLLRGQLDKLVDKVITSLPDEIESQIPAWITAAEQLPSLDGAKRKEWVLDRLDEALSCWHPPLWMRLLPWRKIARVIASKLIDSMVGQINVIVSNLDMIDPFQVNAAKKAQAESSGRV